MAQIKSTQKFSASERKKLRIAVARDVIDSLPAFGHVKPGEWVTSLPYSHHGALSPYERRQLFKKRDSRVIAERLKADCTVCGLGAAFLSLVTLTNDYQFTLTDTGRYCVTRDVIDSTKLTDMLAKLRTVFATKDLYLIESAFECGRNCSFGRVPQCIEARNAAIQFGHQHIAPAVRLKAIMQNTRSYMLAEIAYQLAVMNEDREPRPIPPSLPQLHSRCKSFRSLGQQCALLAEHAGPHCEGNESWA